MKTIIQNLCPGSVIFLETMGRLSHDFGWHSRYIA
jgi:hypothetical protein